MIAKKLFSLITLAGLITGLAFSAHGYDPIVDTEQSIANIEQLNFTAFHARRHHRTFCPEANLTRMQSLDMKIRHLQFVRNSIPMKMAVRDAAASYKAALMDPSATLDQVTEAFADLGIAHGELAHAHAALKHGIVFEVATADQRMPLLHCMKRSHHKRHKRKVRRMCRKLADKKKKKGQENNADDRNDGSDGTEGNNGEDNTANDDSNSDAENGNTNNNPVDNPIDNPVPPPNDTPENTTGPNGCVDLINTPNGCENPIDTPTTLPPPDDSFPGNDPSDPANDPANTPVDNVDPGIDQDLSDPDDTEDVS